MQFSVSFVEDSKKTVQEKVGFALCWLVLITSLILKPEGTSGIKLFGKDIPSVCLFYNLTGYPDLGCGLTRSFVNMAHFHLKDAFYSHFLGPAVFVGFLFAGAYLTYRILGGRKKLKISMSALPAIAITVLIMLAAIAAWIVKLYVGLNGQERLLRF